jgi:putative flippase GtrA
VRFAAVGGLGFLVDVGLFNLLRLTLLADGHVPGAPLIAKSISVLAAIGANWAGNRWWAFRDRRGERPGREALAFLFVSLAGGAFSLVCLGLTHYVLGLTSPVADNVSANVIGLGLGSVFRFVAVRSWVFKPEPIAAAPPEPVAVT